MQPTQGDEDKVNTVRAVPLQDRLMRPGVITPAHANGELWPRKRVLQQTTSLPIHLQWSTAGSYMAHIFFSAREGYRGRAEAPKQAATPKKRSHHTTQTPKPQRRQYGRYLPPYITCIHSLSCSGAARALMVHGGRLVPGYIYPGHKYVGSVYMQRTLRAHRRRPQQYTRQGCGCA